MKKAFIFFITIFICSTVFPATNLYFGGNYTNTAKKDIVAHGVGADFAVMGTYGKINFFLGLGFCYDLTLDELYKTDSQRGGNIRNFDVQNWSIPLTLGYPIFFDISTKTQFILVPAFRYSYSFFNQSFTRYDIMFLGEEEIYAKTNIGCYKQMHEIGSAVNVSLAHKFGNLPFRYGFDLFIPLYGVEDIAVMYEGFANGTDMDRKSYNVFSDFTLKTSPFISLGFEL